MRSLRWASGLADLLKDHPHADDYSISQTFIVTSGGKRQALVNHSTFLQALRRNIGFR